MRKMLKKNHFLYRICAGIIAVLCMVVMIPTANPVYANTYYGSYYMGALSEGDIVQSGTVLYGCGTDGGYYDFARIFINGSEMILFSDSTGRGTYTVPGNYIISKKQISSTFSGDGSYGKGTGNEKYYNCYFYLTDYYTASFGTNGYGTVSSSGGAYATNSSKSSTATPNTGYHFIGWTGTYSSSSNPLSISGRSGSWYANFSANNYTIYYNGNGATNGVSIYSSSHTYNTVKNLSANQYARTGYTFKGWSTSSSATTATYTDSQSVKNLTAVSGGAVTLYAIWEKNESAIQIDLNGGRWTESADEQFKNDENTIITQEYSSTIDISNPVKDGSTFGGWVLNNAMDGSVQVILGGYRYTFGSETVPVMLTAIWRENTAIEIVDHSQFTVNAEELQNLFDSSNLAIDNDKGITLEDVNRGSVKVSVEVTDRMGDIGEELSADMAAIQQVAGKLSPQFFDITVTKTVTPAGSSIPDTPVVLTELPRTAPAKVMIDVTGTDLEGKKTYYVYRYHDGNVEQLSYRDTDGEFYTVDGNIITIYTRKFSTYAVTSGEIIMEGADSLEVGNNNFGVDVQGKVTDSYLIPVYKLDVAWGAMKFEYGADLTEWDPETHSYVTAKDTAGAMGWLARGFENGNNQIIVSNHSNADVLLSFAVSKIGTGLEGVDMSVRQDNMDDGADFAENVLLTKVPTEEADAPYKQAWLRLSGVPTDLNALQSDTYTKVGVITLTVSSTEGSLTPRK